MQILGNNADRVPVVPSAIDRPSGRSIADGTTMVSDFRRFMSDRPENPAGRKLVIINQMPNYLTFGLANAFIARFQSVALIAGGFDGNPEVLDKSIEVTMINRLYDRPGWKKAGSYLLALIRMWWLLMTRYRKHEVLFVSVPPMGYLLNLVLPHRFSMVIWDLYPDTFKVTGMTEKHPVYRMWSWLNRKSFRKAYRIFTIGEVLADAISRYVHRSKLIVHPIWSMFQDCPRIPRDRNQFVALHGLSDRFVVQYSGNIGATHNVELLIDIAERLKEDSKILFQIIGRGPRLQTLQQMAQQRGLSNVQFHPFQPEAMFVHSLSAAHLGVVILNEKVSRGSVPSKAYNLMSFGIPALYISSPDSQLANDANRFGHAACFTASGLNDIVKFIIQMSQQGVDYNQMAEAAKMAAESFRPKNAECFVGSYLCIS